MWSYTEPVFLYLFIPWTLIFTIWLIVSAVKFKGRPKVSYGSKYPILGKIKLWGIYVLPSLALMIIAAAKPVLPGGSTEISKGDVQVVILFDNSLSQRANDLKPSRLEVAKREILGIDSLLREGDKASLFTFGKDSLDKLHLTKDFETLFDQVSRVKFPTKLYYDDTFFNTDFAGALEHIYQSLDRQDAFSEGYAKGKRYNPKKRSNRIVIVFSDGEDQLLSHKPQSPEEAQAKADYIKRLHRVLGEYRKRGLKIYPVGIGTTRGVSWLSLLKGYQKVNDYPEEIEKEWANQTTRLDKANLLALAKETGVQLSGQNWTIESNQESAKNYLKSTLDANRKELIGFEESENDQHLWQYFLLGSVVFLILGIATYPFNGYFRGKSAKSANK